MAEARRPWRRRLRYGVEGALAWLLYALLRLLPLDAASALGGWAGRTVGPRLAVSKRARRNLERALPELSAREAQDVIRRMWDNLGRVAAEYAHLDRFRLYDGDGRVEVIGAEHVDRLRDDGVGGIFVSAHFGNWELASLGASQRGLALTHVYRAANNPLVERLVTRARRAIGGHHYAKGAGTARELLAALGRGEHIGTLADQKLREGILVPFLGRDAPTQALVGQLAVRYRCPVVPARVERLAGARFRLTVFPPLELPESGDQEADIRAVTRQVNALFEEWIRADPAQWLWLHRRWND